MGMRVPAAMRKKFNLPKEPHKYAAEKVEVDGIRFDSKREARLYDSIKLAKDAGQLRPPYFLMQVPFRLDGGTIYRLDFMVFHLDGEIGYLDAKGMKTQVYTVKKREVEHKFGITITEV